MAAEARAERKTAPQKKVVHKKKNGALRTRRAEKEALLASLTPKQLRKYKRMRRRRTRRIIFRTILCLFTVVALLGATMVSSLYVLFRGPSQTFGDLLTQSLLETSALQFVPELYYSETELEQLIARNTVVNPTEETDTSLITIDTGADISTEEEYQDIELHPVTGATYKGIMMIVRDPSRVTLGVSCDEKFSRSSNGKQLYEIAEKYGAVAALNGGGFEDAGGQGNGGMPIGLTIANGVVMCKSKGSGNENVTVGFDQNNKLIVGEMTAAEATERGIRDCVTFGPALVINGEPVAVSGSGSGLNPRSAIGQRADGAVLMLVIDGRHVNSLGASISDLINIMLDFGAINASNLDGGSSALMYYKGEYLNEGVVLTGSRDLPTAFVVK